MTAANSSQTIADQLNSELSAVKIPPRPAALSHVEAEMRSKAPNFATMAQLISVDVGISASLLKVANSAYFGHSGQVRSVSEALQILGLTTVAVSIAALSLRKVFAHVPNLERYWDSSARVALLSGWLVTQIDFPDRKIRPEEAYTFGLFRDCGIPVLMSMYADYFDILEAANAAEERSFTEVECEAMDLDHAMIGAALAKEWQLPIEFRAAIEFHHDVDSIRGLNSHAVPDIARYFIAIAQLSEYMYQRLSGKNKTREWHKLGEACLGVLGIQESDTDQLCQKAEAQRIHTQPEF